MEAKDFIINVGPNGTFRPSGSYQTLPEHIDSIFQRFEKDKVKKISVYFHGGLVSEENGMETAFKMAKHISDIGQAPLCFVWETSLMATVSTNITKISETELFNKLIKVLIKKLSEKLGFDLGKGRGIRNLLTDEKIDAELSKPIPFQHYNQQTFKTSGRGVQLLAMFPPDDDALMKSLEAEFTVLIESDKEFTNAIAATKLTAATGVTLYARGFIGIAPFIKHVAVIAFKVIKRFIDKRDHDFYPTIVEEILRELYIADIGAWVWNNMKVKSSDMWKDNKNLQGLNRFAGRYLLDKLIDYRKANPDTEINLIGHSAGSIAICNLLNTTATADLPIAYSKIVFMAPACRIDLFKKAMLDKTLFKKFRMFTMNNELETQDNLIPFFYTHSLLYLISGILEDEGKEFDAYILGLERNIRGANPYDSATELIDTNKFLFKTKEDRIVFSKTTPTALVGMRTESTSHGDFDDDKDTIESIKYFLK